jgi:CBS domain-containing protein
VGVLSATDFVHWAQKGVRAGVSQDCVCSSWQIVATDCLPKEAVRHYMTKDPVTVTSGARIGDLAQMMIDAHIHRVIVVDREHRPIGIVSSTDILAALAHSVRAAASPGKNTRTPVASA